MRILGTLGASALCLLVSALYGQTVSCGIFSGILSSKKPSTSNEIDIAERQADDDSEGWNEWIAEQMKLAREAVADEIRETFEWKKNQKTKKNKRNQSTGDANGSDTAKKPSGGNVSKNPCNPPVESQDTNGERKMVVQEPQEAL